MKQNLLKTWLMLVCLLVGAGSAWAEDVTVTKTINQLAQENDWKTSTGSQINGTYRDFNLDDNINIKLALALGEEGNSGSIWGSNSTTYDWRLYQTNSPAITISSKGDYVIKTVKFTYSQNNTGVINTKGCEKSIGSSYQITSGKTHNVNANSVTYYLGNSGTASNGQAKITAFEVVYSSTSGGGEPTGDEKTGTIIFGTNDVKINTASVTGEDNLNNTWTITTAGTTSFTSNASYYQVGSSNKPATSITFTTTLPKDVTITKMSAKFGGFSGTAGTVTLKVGSSAIGTGSLNEANDVTVNSTSTAKGKVLTVTLTNIAKGVKVYNISYTYSDEGGGSDPDPLPTPTLSFANPTYNATLGEAFTAPTLTNPQGVAVTYTSSETGVATVNASTGAVEIVAAGTTKITASFAGSETYKANSASYDLVVKEPVALTAPAITTQPASATYTLNATAKNLAVVANGNPEPTYQWYSNTTASNENGTELTGETKTYYNPSTATTGTFYYYCVVTNSEGSATSEVATITVNEPKAASLPFLFDGGKSDIASVDGMSQTGLGTDYSSSPKLKFDSQGDNVVINFNEAAKKMTYTIKGNSTSGTYAFDVMESANGVDYTTVHSYTSITDGTYTDNLSSTSRFVKFVYTTKDNGNVALGKISIVAASVLDDPKLAFEQTSCTFFTNQSDMQVVATSAAGSTGAITYALTEGDKDVFLIDKNTGEIVCATAGTYTVTASIAEATGFTGGTAICTVKIVKPVVGNSIIVAETDGGYYAMTTTCDGSYFVSKAIKKAGDKYVVESLDDILFYTNTVEGKTTIQSTSNAQYVQATAAKSIKYTETEYKWTNDGEKLSAATDGHGTLQYNTSSPRFTTYASKVGQYATIVDLANVVVGEVVTLAATDGESYYATFSSARDVQFASAAEVYAITVSDSKMSLKKVKDNQVSAGNGVLIKSSVKDLAFLYMTGATFKASDDTEITDNMLVPTTTTGTFKAEADGNYYYKLAYGDNTNKTNLGFWWGADHGSGNFKVKAGGAVLCVPQIAGVKGFSLSGGDETVIENLMSNNKQKTIYNLQGVKLQKLQKGVNIVNGRKVIR